MAKKGEPLVTNLVGRLAVINYDADGKGLDFLTVEIVTAYYDGEGDVKYSGTILGKSQSRLQVAINPEKPCGDICGKILNFYDCAICCVK